jgi:hypothetical protein
MCVCVCVLKMQLQCFRMNFIGLHFMKVNYDCMFN